MQFVGELKHNYDHVCQRSKDVLNKLEQSVQDHQQYQDAIQDFSDWLITAHDSLEACSDRSGDKVSLHRKKEQLKVRFYVSQSETALMWCISLPPTLSHPYLSIFTIYMHINIL